MSDVHKVILLLRRIPRQKVVSYGELARACGTSPRAVGSIMRCNRDPSAYPCYKVIKSDGSVGGYSGGVKKKIIRLKKNGIIIKNGKIEKKYFYKFSA